MGILESVSQAGVLKMTGRVDSEVARKKVMLYPGLLALWYWP
jgi:hypothetical protein